MNLAPRLSTCSLAANRTSVASTLQPSRLAVAIAWSPATPAPKITALAGGTVPAAVIKSGQSTGISAAPIRTAL